MCGLYNMIILNMIIKWLINDNDYNELFNNN